MGVRGVEGGGGGKVTVRTLNSKVIFPTGLATF